MGASESIHPSTWRSTAKKSYKGESSLRAKINRAIEEADPDVCPTKLSVAQNHMEVEDKAVSRVMRQLVSAGYTDVCQSYDDVPAQPQLADIVISFVKPCMSDAKHSGQ